MKVIDAIKRRIAQDDHPTYDPAKMRADVAAGLAEAMAAAYPDAQVSRVDDERLGPLGGVSSRFTVGVETPVGRRHCIVTIYAAGVFAPEQMAEWGLTGSDGY